MRIAVIADTHGKLPSGVMEELRTADEIWHLGDFCDQPTLAAVQRIGRPFYGVLGNNDHGLDLPDTVRLERGGPVVFAHPHSPATGADRRRGRADPWPYSRAAR